MICTSSSISEIGFIFSLSDVFSEVLIIKPVRVLLPKGAMALTPKTALASNSLGTL
jgi:hypothetical protein